MTMTPHSTARQRSIARRGLLGVAAPLVGLGAFGGAMALAEDPPPGNLTPNPSFETDPSVEWQGFRSGVIQVALPGEAPSGAYAVTVVADATADALEGYSIDDRDPSGGTDVPAGTQFVGSAYMRAAAPQSIDKLGKVWVRERAAGSLIDRISAEAPLTGVFQKLTTPVYTVKRAGAEVDVYIAQNPAAPGDAFTADLVTLTRNLPPAGSITANRASASSGDEITFSSSGVADPEGGPITRAWDLDGDGNYAEGTGVTASRKFSGAGTYTVRLSAADGSGATAIFPIKVVVGRTGGVSVGVDGAGAVIGAGLGIPSPRPRVTRFKAFRRKGVAYARFNLSQRVRLAARLERRRVGKRGYAKIRTTKSKNFGQGRRIVKLGKLKAGRYRVKMTIRYGAGQRRVVVKGFRLRR